MTVKGAVAQNLTLEIILGSTVDKLKLLATAEEMEFQVVATKPKLQALLMPLLQVSTENKYRLNKQNCNILKWKCKLVKLSQMQPIKYFELGKIHQY